MSTLAKHTFICVTIFFLFYEVKAFIGSNKMGYTSIFVVHLLIEIDELNCIHTSLYFMFAQMMRD